MLDLLQFLNEISNCFVMYNVHLVFLFYPPLGAFLCINILIYSASTLHFSFQYWRNVHLSIVCSLLFLTIIVQLHKRFLTARWATRRLMLYISAVAYGVGPVVHWIYLNGGLQAPIVQVRLQLKCIPIGNCYLKI